MRQAVECIFQMVSAWMELEAQQRNQSMVILQALQASVVHWAADPSSGVDTRDQMREGTD